MSESEGEGADGPRGGRWREIFKASTFISLVAVGITIWNCANTRASDWGALEQHVANVVGRLGKAEGNLEEVKSRAEGLIGLEKEVRFSHELIDRLEDDVEEVTKHMKDIEGDLSGRIWGELSELRERLAVLEARLQGMEGQLDRME